MPTIIKNINDLNKILEQRVTMAMKMAISQLELTQMTKIQLLNFQKILTK